MYEEVSTFVTQKHDHSTLKVLKSVAGWYIGRFCPLCGAWSRNSWYFGSEEEAAEVLASWLKDLEE